MRAMHAATGARGRAGIAPTLRRALAVAPLAALWLALLLAGCRGGGAPKGVDAAALLQRSAERMERAHSFHFLLEHQHGATQIVSGLRMTRAEGDVVGTDRLRADVQASAGPLNVKVGIVVLPDQAWLTNPVTGRWERSEVTLGQVFDPANGVTALMRAVRDASVTGSERVGGVDTYRIEATVDSGSVTLFGPPRAGQPVHATAWIGVADPLPYRLLLRGPVTAAEASDVERQLTLSAFDSAIEIAPPR